MNKGDKFKVEGYDIVATALFAEGGGGYEDQAIVLNNNSTHYIVATRASGSDIARYRRSFEYASDEQDALEVYGVALDVMIQIAKGA